MALVAVVVLVATAIQAWTSAVELGRTAENRMAIDTWDAEDALTAEHRWPCRRRVRRELKAMRGRQLHAEIRRLQLTLASWVGLVAASALALIDTLST